MNVIVRVHVGGISGLHMGSSFAHKGVCTGNQLLLNLLVFPSVSPHREAVMYNPQLIDSKH